MSRDEEQQSKSEFEEAGANTEAPGILREFIDFLRQNKKWWLLPIVLIMLLLGVLLVLAPGAAPFIYTLF